MNQQLAHIALLVDDYDKAIKFYTEQLHFTLIEDTQISPLKRWVLVKPTGNGNCSILLAKAATTFQSASIGKQSGGRVFLFLYTDDFERDYQNLLAQKIEIVRTPSHENYGIVAVFKDVYGNLWDLIQPNNLNTHTF